MVKACFLRFAYSCRTSSWVSLYKKLQTPRKINYQSNFKRYLFRPEITFFLLANLCSHYSIIYLLCIRQLESRDKVDSFLMYGNQNSKHIV